MAFDVIGAKQAGYSDSEIADHLAEQSKFDAQGARKSGYSDEEIISHLSAPPQRTALERIGRGAGLIGRAAIQGAAALPTMIANLPAAAANKVIEMAGGDYRFPEQQAGLSNLLTRAGLPQPETPQERIQQEIIGTVAGITPTMAAGQALRTAAQPLTRRIGEQLAAQPISQLAAAGGAGAGMSTAKESGASVPVQIAAGLAGGIAGTKATVPKAQIQPTMKGSVAQESRQEGYVIPPSQTKPGMVSGTLEGVSGKAQTWLHAAAKNQDTTQRLAAKSVGLKPENLSPANLASIRSDAGQVYAELAKQQPFKPDAQFQSDLLQLSRRNRMLEANFPTLVKSEVDTLVKSMQGGRPINSEAAVEAIKQFRADATKNLSSMENKPAMEALGKAQKAAADALENLIDRNLRARGKPGLVTDFRNARQTIAKTYSLEEAINPATGSIDANKIAKAWRSGDRLSGELLKIAKFGAAFPEAAKNVTTRSVLPVSPLDLYAGAGLGGVGIASGNPLLAATALARPAIRSAILSKPYQQYFAATPGTGPRLADLLSPYTGAGLSAIANTK